MKKPFIYCKSLTAFNKLNVATDSSNTIYIKDNVQTFGKLDILWEHIVFIEEDKMIWTHGEFYHCKQQIIIDDENINIDLSDYYTKTDVDTKLDDFYIKTDIDTKLDDFFTKEEVNTKFNDVYTKEEVDTKIGDINSILENILHVK